MILRKIEWNSRLICSSTNLTQVKVPIILLKFEVDNGTGTLDYRIELTLDEAKAWLKKLKNQ